MSNMKHMTSTQTVPDVSSTNNFFTITLSHLASTGFFQLSLRHSLLRSMLTVLSTRMQYILRVFGFPFFCRPSALGISASIDFTGFTLPNETLPMETSCVSLSCSNNIYHNDGPYQAISIGKNPFFPIGDQWFARQMTLIMVLLFTRLYPLPSMACIKTIPTCLSRKLKAIP
jgi:hypothetical protein